MAVTCAASRSTGPASVSTLSTSLRQLATVPTSSSPLSRKILSSVDLSSAAALASRATSGRSGWSGFGRLSGATSWPTSWSRRCAIGRRMDEHRQHLADRQRDVAKQIGLEPQLSLIDRGELGHQQSAAGEQHLRAAAAFDKLPPADELCGGDDLGFHIRPVRHGERESAFGVGGDELAGHWPAAGEHERRTNEVGKGRAARNENQRDRGQ